MEKCFIKIKKLFYEGQFENNKINGKGIKYYKNGKIKNEGIFSNNFCINTNKIYEGGIFNGLYNGEGIEYCPLINNKIFEGYSKNNHFEIPDIDINEPIDKKLNSFIISYGCSWKNNFNRKNIRN